MSEQQAERAPRHCGRAMWAVKNRSGNELPINVPIWWCPECHHRLPRTEQAEEPYP